MSKDMDIKGLLKQHLAEEQQLPPMGLFDQIEEEIIKKEGRKKRFFFLMWLGVGLAIFSGGWLVGKHYCGQSNVIGTQLMKSHKNCGIDEHYLHLNKNLSVPISQSKLYQQTEKEAQFDQLITTNSTELINNDRSSDDQSYFTRRNNVREFNQDTKNSNSYPFSSAKNKSLNQNKLPSNIQQQENNVLNKLKAAPTKLITKNSTQLSNTEEAANFNKDPTHLPISPINKSTRLVNSISEDSIDVITPLENDIDTIITSSLKDTLTNERDTLNTKDSLNNISDILENIPPNKQKTHHTSVVIYAGPTAYNLAVFKPYFESGILSKHTSTSSGLEFGLGINQQLKNRFDLLAGISYNQKKTVFNYNLMISESDYFDLYTQGLPIPVTNLDAPNSCNCFLAEDANLSYKISTLALSLGFGYTLYSTTKFTLKSQFKFGTNLQTSYNQISSNIIEFPQDITERFNTFNLQISAALSYYISPKITVGLMPAFGYLFTTEKSLLKKNIPELILPVKMNYFF